MRLRNNLPIDRRTPLSFDVNYSTTAERLGLEHHAIKSAPDIEVLRDAGVESPSGRLVVDISRLREKRALSSGSNEIKVLGSEARRENSTLQITNHLQPSSFLDKVKRILGKH